MLGQHDSSTNIQTVYTAYTTVVPTYRLYFRLNDSSTNIQTVYTTITQTDVKRTVATKLF